VQVPLTTPSCPRCGAPAPAATPTCAACGFVLFEEDPPRRRPQLWIAAGLVAAVVAGVVAVLLARDQAAAAPDPVAAAVAEPRLERQLGTDRGGPQGSVSCPGAIRPERATRCQFRYRDGDTQLMLVTVRAHGELEIDVPYPAQRRPG
jgi:ribosomal protein L37E